MQPSDYTIYKPRSIHIFCFEKLELDCSKTQPLSPLLVTPATMSNNNVGLFSNGNSQLEIIKICIAIMIILAFIFVVVYRWWRNLPSRRPPLPGGAKRWVEQLELVVLLTTMSERVQLGLRAADECC